MQRFLIPVSLGRRQMVMFVGVLVGLVYLVSWTSRLGVCCVFSCLVKSAYSTRHQKRAQQRTLDALARHGDALAQVSRILNYICVKCPSWDGMRDFTDAAVYDESIS